MDPLQQQEAAVEEARFRDHWEEGAEVVVVVVHRQTHPLEAAAEEEEGEEEVQLRLDDLAAAAEAEAQLMDEVVRQGVPESSAGQQEVQVEVQQEGP